MLQCLALLCALVSAGDAFAVQPPFRAASHRPVGSSRPVMLEPLTVGGMAKLGLVIGMALGKRAIKDERPAPRGPSARNVKRAPRKSTWSAASHGRVPPPLAAGAARLARRCSTATSLLAA